MFLDANEITLLSIANWQRQLKITPGGGVPATRRIDTTFPLLGGGDFSINRTHSIDTSALFALGISALIGGIDGNNDSDDSIDFNSNDYTVVLDANGV